MREPTPKQQRFCLEYMTDFNGKQAAIRAGYSSKTAAGQASMLLAMPHIKAYISVLAKPKAASLAITSERVLEEISRIAFNDPGAYYKRNQYGVLQLRGLDEMTVEQRAAIKQYDQVTGLLVLHDKPRALEMAGRHLKLFTELDAQQPNFTIMGDIILTGGIPLEFNVGEKPKPK